MVSWKKDSHGRIVSLLVRSNDVDVNLVNIYAPTNLAEQKISFDSLSFSLILSFFILSINSFRIFKIINLADVYHPNNNNPRLA